MNNHFEKLVRIGAVNLCVMAMASCTLHHMRHAKPPGENAPATEPPFSTSISRENIRPEWLKPSTKEYTLGPGDKVEIEVLGEANTRMETFVTPNGMLYYSVAPGLDVRSKQLSQVKKDLEASLADIYSHPQVSVRLIDVKSQRIWVLGRLNNPGIFPLNRPLRVLDAVSLAGGLFSSSFNGTTEEIADLSHSFIKRGDRIMPVNLQKLLRDGDSTQNIYLQPNDFVYLPSSLSNEVYILGAVTEPHPIGFMGDMTILTAISRAHGATSDADLKHVTVVRGSLTEPTFTVIDVQSIINGKAPNVRLSPGDIVHVPMPGQMSAESYARLAVDTFAKVIGVNEGGHAVSRDNASHVGVSIGLDGNLSTTTTVRK